MGTKAKRLKKKHKNDDRLKENHLGRCSLPFSLGVNVPQGLFTMSYCETKLFFAIYRQSVRIPHGNFQEPVC